MSGSHTDRRERAFALLARLDPQAPTRVAASLDALSPELAELVLGFAFADVLARPGIDLCTREMLTVATLMGMGTAPGQLEFRPQCGGQPGDHHRDPAPGRRLCRGARLHEWHQCGPQRLRRP
ncbi:hypothetical protein MXE95_04775 [Aeromonas caviae]|uniref:carboxymuconolactone decarboxylase family protein n=1 Tax=Aeromonas caviae TaxID=648 RepID=UPI002DBB32B7|nr:hypothetical protein [Aeromonas caviae]MEB5773423.1 hypothetical protein [Aeromonas caviae]MEB6648563.1 hypothetical protein [Aeromonas caviae]